MSRTTDIQLAGKTLYVPSANVCGRTVVATCNWLRFAALKDEELVEGDAVLEPARFLEELRHTPLRADIFSFTQKPPDIVPKYHYYFEWDNWAAISLKSFEDWWKGLPQESRKNVRRAAKRGVAVKVIGFSDELVKGVQTIYDESPIRQGRRFWHFGKDFATVKREIGTYLERSDFLAAYLNQELVGFVKVTYVDRIATIMQILTKSAHHEARPMNALLARTVELCQTRQMSFLLYGKYVYGRHTQSLLTEFKRRNGFEEIRVPRYFVPLTTKGRLAIKLRLHSGLRDRLPAPLISLALSLRSRWYDLSQAGLRRRSRPSIHQHGG